MEYQSERGKYNRQSIESQNNIPSNNRGNEKISEVELANRQCDFYLNSLKQLYDERISFLSDYLADAMEHLKNDHILTVMKDDPTLQEFVSERIKEVITNSIAAEREMEIHNLMQDLAMARSEKVSTENGIHKLSLRVMELEKQECDVNDKLNEGKKK